jgi:hypothetical protein
MKRLDTLALIGVLCVGTMNGRSRGSVDWPTYRGDPYHAGRSDASLNPTQLQHAWQSPVGYQNPVIAGNLVYAQKWNQSGPLVGTVTAFDRRTGSLVWTTDGNYHAVTPVTIAGGMAVYEAEDPLGIGGSALFVRDAQSGALKYTFPVGSFSPQNPVNVFTDPADNSTVAFVSGSGTSAITLGATSATLKWVQGDGFSVYATPAIVGGAVVAGNGGNGRAYDRATGTPKTFFTDGSTGGVTANVSVDSTRGRIFMASSSGMRAFQYHAPWDITPLWNAPAISADGPTVAENGDVFGINSGLQLVQLDGGTGQLIRSSAATNFNGPDGPILQGEYIWAGGLRNTYDEEVRVLDRATLSVVRSFPAGDAPDYTYYSPPALADGTAVIPFKSGVSEWRGFDVYLAPDQLPEPVLIVPSVLFITAAVGRKRKQQRG